MISIIINGRKADLDASTYVSVTLSISNLTRLDISKTNYTKSIKLPMTHLNREILGDVDQVNSPFMFNQMEYRSEVIVDGSLIMEGKIYMLSSSYEHLGAGYYNIVIVGPGKDWVDFAGKKLFRQIPIDFTEKISGEMIRNSWSWDKAVRFLPVQRDKFLPDNISSNISTPVRILTFEDYHPFINASILVEKIFEEAGYKINSEFLDSEFFRTIYISGNYPRKNTELIKSRMDFLAGCFNDKYSNADSLGRVYANPYLGVNSIGNIVDTANPSEISNETNIEGIFTTGDYFTREDERIVFTPPYEVMTSFEYQIYYTTDYYILNRHELSGFNCVNLEDGQLRKYKIANRHHDKKEEFRSGRSYTVIIFNYEDNLSYQFRYHLASGNSSETFVHENLEKRASNIIVFETDAIDPEIWIKDDITSEYEIYKGDWALYDGYVEERGTIEIELTVRSSTERILPSQPKYFDTIFFGGAEPGMNFKLSNKTRLRPIFAVNPSEGQTVNFEDIAAHENYSLEVIKAIKHLFNLQFYTDHIANIVYIEPRDAFYRNDVIIDWSNKIDYLKPIIIREPGDDLARTINIEYQAGDGAATLWNRNNQEKFGRWKAIIYNNLAAEEERAFINPLFTPSIGSSGVFPDAPSALLIQVGERDSITNMKSDSLNFPMKIVSYKGMKTLPKEQHWGWPSNENNYPFLSFHHVEIARDTTQNAVSEITKGEDRDESFTFCFEDRDGLTGLHSYWDHTINLCNNSKYLELYLNLHPKDIEQIISPNNMMQDFRALYRLKINGEHALFRLEKISEYNPSSGESTKCIFIKEI